MSPKRNARAIRDNLWSGLTYTGLDGYKIFGEKGCSLLGIFISEVYRDAFCDALQRSTKAALVDMPRKLAYWIGVAEEFENVGDFLADEKAQLPLICAFGIVLSDRLVRIAQESSSGWAIIDQQMQIQECYDYAIVGTDNAPGYREIREQRARGGLERARRDPRTAEKLLVKECWQSWRKYPDQYASKAAFARAMLDKCEHLTSQKQIEDWCRTWEKREGSKQAEH